MEAVLPVGLSSTNLRQRVRVLARQLEVRMLVIDEIHAMLSGTFREQRIFLNCLRFLANDLHLPLVCVGTNEAKQAIGTADGDYAESRLPRLLRDSCGLATRNFVLLTLRMLSALH
jgi:Bacterial TniB protein